MYKGKKICLAELESLRIQLRDKEEEYRLLCVAERLGGTATLARLVEDVPEPKPASFKSKIRTKFSTPEKPKDK